MSIHKQTNLWSFSAMCVAASFGLLALKSHLNISTVGASPDEDSARYTTVAKLRPGPSHATTLIVQGAQVPLGGSATVEFDTNADGVGRVDVALSRLGAGQGQKRDLSLMHSMGVDRLAWSGDAAVLSGLVPNARYKVEMALWFWAQPIQDGTGALEPYKAFTHPLKNVEDCQNQCVAAFSAPNLMAIHQGPVWREAEVVALDKTIWFSPALLILAGLAWRGKLREVTRRTLVAAGAGDALPRKIGVPKVG